MFFFRDKQKIDTKSSEILN